MGEKTAKLRGGHSKLKALKDACRKERQNRFKLSLCTSMLTFEQLYVEIYCFGFLTDFLGLALTLTLDKEKAIFPAPEKFGGLHPVSRK